MDRSTLESKAVAELKEIAKSLDVKVTGLKKSQIVDAIDGAGGNGRAKPEAKQSSTESGKKSSDGGSSNNGQPRQRESAPPAPTGSGGASEGGRDAGVRDEGAVDDSDRRDDGGRQQRRPQNRDQRNRPREKAEPRGDNPRDGGRGGRRRRRGRGGQSGGTPHFMREERWEDLEAEDDPNAEVRTGILDLLPEGYGFMRTSGYLPGDKDVYVSVSQTRRFHLRKGDEITGSVRSPKESEKYQALLKVHTINGMDPELAQKRPRFQDLVPLYPQDRLTLEQSENPRDITPRIIDLIAPIGKGQRGMIVSPPKAGKTTVMKEIANSVRTNNPETVLIVLLVDERPEEVTDWQRTVQAAEVVYSTFDRPADQHI